MQFFRRFALLVSVLVVLSLGAPFLVGVRGQQPAQQRPRRVTTPESGAAQKPTTTNSSTDEIDEGDVVRVDTQLVSVPAIVTNGAGRPLAGLRMENFLLFENGTQ